MTRERALELLERNPRCAKPTGWPIWPPDCPLMTTDKLDALYLFGQVSSEEDATVNWIEVWKAAGLID
jgi:hypothetical protein